MARDEAILESFMKLPPNERAAALGHWIYVQTARKGEDKWPLRVAESWSDLDAAPKELNILMIDTWSDHPQVLDAWLDAVNAYRKERDRKRSRI
jgi:hypothetical protein